MASTLLSPPEETSIDGRHPETPSSLPLSPARQALVDDIIALYCCHPTRDRILRYTPDCVFDDQFVHADDRYKVAEQWFAQPQLFESSTNEGYKVVRSDSKVIQFIIQQTWTFRMATHEAMLKTRVTPTIDALITLTLDPDTVKSQTIRITRHTEQASAENYNRELIGYTFKMWQAEKVAKQKAGPEIEAFRRDKRRDSTEHRNR